MLKIPVSELLRLACVYAEEWELSFIDAVKDSHPEVAAESLEFVRQLWAYRLRRWGKTPGEVALESARPVPIQEILKRGDIQGAIHDYEQTQERERP